MESETALTGEPTPDFPVRFDVEYPEQLSRWLIFVKWLLAFPHYVALYLLGVAASIVGFIAFFVILFTKRYPRGLFNFAVGVNRWSANLSAYTGLLRDEYPPFSTGQDKYPLTYQVDYPENLSRWLIFVKWLLAIPHYVVIILLYIAASLAGFVAFFAILFTKRYPRGLFDFVVGVSRWNARINAYVGLLTDRYPPFTLR